MGADYNRSASACKDYVVVLGATLYESSGVIRSYLTALGAEGVMNQRVMLSGATSS